MKRHDLIEALHGVIHHLQMDVRYEYAATIDDAIEEIERLRETVAEFKAENERILAMNRRLCEFVADKWMPKMVVPVEADAGQTHAVTPAKPATNEENGT